MYEYIQWIEYVGKKILFCDFSNFNEKQYIEGVDGMEKELLTQSRGSNILMIVDVTHSSMTLASSERGKQCIAVLSKAGITTKTAMVGITGLKKIITQAISKDVYCAKDMDAAKNWVVA